MEWLRYRGALLSSVWRLYVWLTSVINESHYGRQMNKGTCNPFSVNVPTHDVWRGEFTAQLHQRYKIGHCTIAEDVLRLEIIAFASTSCAYARCSWLKMERHRAWCPSTSTPARRTKKRKIKFNLNLLDCTHKKQITASCVFPYNSHSSYGRHEAHHSSRMEC